jgi:formylglycine-generating enzyme required for sulfatase activity/uncharacterized caspase-like protein
VRRRHMARPIRAMVFLALALGAVTMALGDGARRVALVIGNGAYEKGALPNPVNDATDVAASLRASGFEVILRTDLRLSQMEQIVREFGDGVQRGDVALFYYAGHGLESGGANYLIPVDNGSLLREEEIRYKAMDAELVLDSVAGGGAGLSIVILDACRDNPLKSRSTATRGLAVMAAPAGMEAVIVYATAPGSTATDGTGRNSVFTTALLQEIGKPGVGIRELFDGVGRTARELSGGRQVPWLSSTPLSQPFSFVTAGAALAQAQAERQRLETEIAAIEREIAAREAVIAATKDQGERRKLETEQQKQKALEAAKRIEAETTKREADRLAAEEQRARAEAVARQEQQRADSELAATLARQVADRRAEFEALKRSDDTADAMVAEIEGLAKAIAEIEATYARAVQAALGPIGMFYDGKVAGLSKLAADPWESKKEFEQRVEKEREKLAVARRDEERARQMNLEEEKREQVAELERRLSTVRTELEAKRWTVSGSDVAVILGSFDAERKVWPLTLRSTAPELPYETSLEHSIADAKDMRAAYTAVDAAARANALAGEVEYRIGRAGSGFRVTVTGIVVRNVADGSVLANWHLEDLVARFAGAADRLRLQSTQMVSVRDLVRVEGGTFRLGDEGSGPSVTLSPFLLGRTEVTQIDWRRVMGTNPSGFEGADLPVDGVTWYDAVTFCNKLSKLEGLEPCYAINGVIVTCDFTKNGCRLPTEAEWEFAARGGTLSAKYTYSGSNTVGEVAWYASNSEHTSHPAGTKAGNELGFYDMSGNVSEWCWDIYGSYIADAQKDPVGGYSRSWWMKK